MTDTDPVPPSSGRRAYTAAEVRDLALTLQEQVHRLIEGYTFTLPADAPMGEVALCPCCGAEWQQTTSGRARWVPKGVRG